MIEELKKSLKLSLKSSKSSPQYIDFSGANNILEKCPPDDLKSDFKNPKLHYAFSKKSLEAILGSPEKGKSLKLLMNGEEFLDLSKLNIQKFQFVDSSDIKISFEEKESNATWKGTKSGNAAAGLTLVYKRITLISNGEIFIKIYPQQRDIVSFNEFLFQKA